MVRSPENPPPTPTVQPPPTEVRSPVGEPTILPPTELGSEFREPTLTTSTETGTALGSKEATPPPETPFSQETTPSPEPPPFPENPSPEPQLSAEPSEQHPETPPSTSSPRRRLALTGTALTTAFALGCVSTQTAAELINLAFSTDFLPRVLAGALNGGLIAFILFSSLSRGALEKANQATSDKASFAWVATGCLPILAGTALGALTAASLPLPPCCWCAPIGLSITTHLINKVQQHKA